MRSMYRRKPFIAASIVCSAMVLAACGSSGDSTSSEDTAGAEQETQSESEADASLAGSELTFVSWGGGYQEAQENLIVKPWAEENGVTLFSDGPTDYSKLTAQVESGNVTWDVITLEPFFAIANCDTLLEPISALVNTENLPPEAVSDCGIPFDVLSYVLVYNEDQFGDNPPTSWADFFDTTNFPGKRGVWNYAPGGQLEAALLADGVPLEDLYPLDVPRALAKLDTIKSDIAFYDTGAQQVQQMQSGEVAMTIAWSGRALDAVRAGAPYAPVWKDNLMLVDSFSVPKGSKNLDGAISMINTATSPFAQEAFVEAYTYGVVNSLANPQLDEVATKFYPTAPGNGDQGRFMDQDWWAANFSDASAEWTKWASG